MKRKNGFIGIQKARHFTQKEAEMLSGCNRNQLRKLNDNQLVVPITHPPILYSWSQIIFLRTLFRLSENWSWKQLEIIFLYILSYGVDKFINKIENAMTVLVILEDDGDIFVEVLGTANFEENELYTKKFLNAIENIKNGEKLELEQALEIIKYIAKDSYEQSCNSTFGIKKHTLIIIPEIIREIVSLAKELEIKDFDLKVG